MKKNYNGQCLLIFMCYEENFYIYLLTPNRGRKVSKEAVMSGIISKNSCKEKITINDLYEDNVLKNFDICEP
jgi:hypothetical protein